MQIFAPMYADYDNLNNLSLVLKFVHGDNSFLFTGDLENEGELDLEHSNWDLDCDVIKIGHHGSAGSSSENFLRKVSPEIAVFEVSRVNYHGHPRKEVIDKLRNTGCQQMYFTASNGNIAIVSDGLSLRVETEKE